MWHFLREGTKVSEGFSQFLKFSERVQNFFLSLQFADEKNEGVLFLLGTSTGSGDTCNRPGLPGRGKLMYGGVDEIAFISNITVAPVITRNPVLIISVNHFQDKTDVCRDFCTVRL